MCGIAGVYALTDRPPDPAWGPLLVEALRHRGPDGEGVYADHRVVLAHTRLAIIDLGPGGQQPMHSADGRFVIVQNGEIYNYRDVRPALEREGATLRTQSDTEVLLESLARRGTEGLADLRGMWAFALYDRSSGELLLARDRLGKKPLVYCRTPEYLAFASEVSALLRLPFVRARIDRASLRHYLQLLYVPSPWTLVEGVRKLEPAGVLHIDARDPARGAAATRYWRLPEVEPDLVPDRAWFESLDRLLLEATGLRTVSDVPIGIFLSGGIDSNTVLAYLRRAGQRPIRAFTVGFSGLPDERALARAGARACADDHVEVVVEPDLAGEIPGILRRFGEPLGDSAVINNALIAREAARHVKVILNGDGGDEAFGGYSRYSFSRRLDIASTLPGARALLARLYRGRPQTLEVFARRALGDPAGAARSLGSVTTDAQADALLAPGLPSPHPVPDPTGGGPGLTGAMFGWDTGVYLPDDLLVKVDVASMAFGLENRSPFLDHRLFEHVARLAPWRRADWRVGKPLLRRLARGRIPEAVLAARKRGFDLPLARWLRGPLRGWLDGLLADPAGTAPLFRPRALASALEAFHRGAPDPLAPYRIWGLAALEFWAREFGIEVGE